MFQAEAVKIVQRTVSFTEGLIRIVGELVGISADNLKGAAEEPHNIHLTWSIEPEVLNSIIRIWAGAMDYHRTAWPQATGFDDQKYYLHHIVGDLTRLKGEASVEVLAQVSARCSEYVYLLFTSCLCAISGTKHGTELVHSNTSLLLKKIPNKDVLLKSESKKVPPIVYDWAIFEASIKNLLKGLNLLSRYPFKPNDRTQGWPQVTLAALKLASPNLVDSALGTSPEPDLTFVSSGLIMQLEESANLFRHGLLVCMKNMDAKDKKWNSLRDRAPATK